MHVLEVTPAPCLCCGKGNTPDANGDSIRFVDLERDVNWNDPAILCEDCIASVAALVGMASKDDLGQVNALVSEKDREIHELRSKVAFMETRARRLGVEFSGKAEETVEV